MIQIRADSLEINGRTNHWTGREDTCRVCDLVVRELVEHVVLECSRHKESACLRENIVSTMGLKVEEMDREDQMCVFWASRKENKR